MSFNARESGTSKSHPLAKIVRGRGRPVSRSFLKGIFQGIGRRIWSFAGFFAQEEARQGIGDFGDLEALSFNAGDSGTGAAWSCYRARGVLLF